MNNNLNLNDLIADSRLAFIQGRYDESLKLAKQAIELDEKSADAHQCAANAYMSQADYQSAIKHYQKAIEYDEENGDRYFNLGYAFASNNQAADALAMFAKADEKGCSPNVTGQLYKIMAMLCFDMHKYEDAILNFIKAEQIIGIDMDILQRKSLSYSMSGDTSSAIEVANQMKLLAPTDYMGYRIAFNILLQEERLEEAEKELDRAERFAKPKSELFFDWLTYRMAQFKIDGDNTHLEDALQKINQGLCVLKPEVKEVIDSYINATEIYVQLENSEMALNCLNAARNPIQSYNSGFSILEVEEKEKHTVRPLSLREIEQRIQQIKRQYGARQLEAKARENERNARRNAPNNANMTPVSEIQPDDIVFRIDESADISYTQKNTDQINRLYVAIYTLKNDIPHIKTYAAKLANSPDLHSKYIGRYSLAKALHDEKNANYREEYSNLLKFLRNAMIKDPSDLFALNFRIQCHIDLGEYDEAEKLCRLLSDDLKKPLMEQVEKAKSGGDN